MGLNEGNGVNSDLRAASVHGLFERQAGETPDAAALVFGKERLTYRELDERAESLAAHLQTLGLAPGGVAGLCVERSLGAMVGLLAILKTGAAYLPLDPAYPRERLGFMLEDSGAAILVTQEGLENLFTGNGVRRVDMDGVFGQVRRLTQPPSHAEAPSGLAYVIYTSGSTGRPKGVAMPHGPLLNLLAWQRGVLPGPARTLQFASLSFDVSFQEIFSTWCTGGTLVLVPEAVRRDPAALWSLLGRERIERLFLPFVALQQLAEAAPLSLSDSLRDIITAGEQLRITPRIVELFEKLPGCSLHNHYGPSETHVVTALTLRQPPSAWPALPAIGRAIANTVIHLLDPALRPVPAGDPGELHVAGASLCDGYLHHPELTAAKFIANPFAPGTRLYKTGDMARLLPGGDIEFLGRADDQVKIRGVRVELGEIESALGRHPQVSEVAVAVRAEQLAAYIKPKAGSALLGIEELRRFVRERLPEHFVPSSFSFVERLPLTPSGKIDRAALPAPHAPAARPVYFESDAERRVAAIWQEVHRRNTRPRGQFFRRGRRFPPGEPGASRPAGGLRHRVSRHRAFRTPFGEGPGGVSPAARRSCAVRCRERPRPKTKGCLGAETAVSYQRMSESIQAGSQEGVAIVGMAGRFPGADDIGAFWRNLCGGVDSISRFTEAELREAGVSQSLLENPSYVGARALFRDAECFDAQFFGYNPREADLTDPQHRIFLETAWQALEDAGCDPERYPGTIGVYAGVSLNTYLLANLCADRKFIDELVGGHQVTGYEFLLGNDKDYLSTRVSYKLNLRGPSMTIQTACSTSLVAISQACQSLLNYQCDAALAGAVSISFPRHRGYLHQEGSLASADGSCRAFDAQATGTVFGDGAGVVVLKRLEDAIASRDSIYAVIKGFALNNDGSSKVGYTAPSVAGQAEVIAMAQEMAGFQPETITCIEAHGTATPLGDPIEMAGLTQAFRSRKGNYCAIGSVKTNVGHLEVAAGVCGLMKMALALQHKLIPPSLHFDKPNPKIDFANSPFYVNTELTEWKAGETPRRAGVSSFGVGGTNAHVVLEEAPAPEPAAESRASQLLVLSAKTAAALERATANLVRHLEADDAESLADIAWTLQTGRQAFQHRRALVARSAPDAIQALSDPKRVLTRQSLAGEASVVFMFPGQGAQYVNMGRELYEKEPVFRDTIDLCAGVLQEILGANLRGILYPAPGGEEAAEAQLTRTSVTQPALFAVEYALASLWMSWGIRPKAMIGHSVGEYVAACLAGVFSLEDALLLLARRARLMQDLPAGGRMLAVRMGEAELRPLLAENISLAAINGPSLCVVSGPEAATAALAAKLEAAGSASKQLCTSHAFHSAMMDPILEAFTALVSKTPLHAPAIPYVSNVSAGWITPVEAASPVYWARHLRETVRFSEGMGLLVAEPEQILLEVGPGQALATFARQHPAKKKEQAVIASLPVPGRGEVDSILHALGQLWVHGAPLNSAGLYSRERRRRVHLPAYPFERVRHFVEPPKHVEMVSIPVGETLLPVPSAAVESAAPAPVAAGLSRKAKIVSALVDVLKELSGRDRAELDPAANFFELGFDSLFLTQASQGFRKKFGVKITFRQLLEELSSVDAIADYLDQQLPADQFREEKPAAKPIGHATGMFAPATPETALDGMARQLQAMAQQIEALRTGATSVAGNGNGNGGNGHALLKNGASNGAPPAPFAPPEKKESKVFGPYRPIEKSAGAGFTPRQQAHLDALVERYDRRTPKSKRYTQAHRPKFADPRAVAGFRQFWKEMVYPVVAARSAGSKIWDIDGNEYVDVTMGFGTNILGHSPAFITDAIRKQLDLGVEVGPQSPLAGEVAELLCDLTGMERAAFCNTGSEAVLAAIRLARTVTGRTRIATMSGAFHGINDEVLVRPSTINGEPRAVPVAPGIPPHAVSEVFVLNWGDPHALEVLKTLVHDLAAVLVEPVQSRHPDVQPVEFLREVRRITREGGAALIFDEVITGFRSHPGGAQALFGIRADMATYGKIIGGGMPIGALCGSAEYMDALDGGAWSYGDASFPEVGVTFFAGTYVRHPLAMAAAQAILGHLKKAGPALQQELAERTARFAKTLNAFFEENGAPMRIIYFRSLFYFDFGGEIKYPSLLFFHLREKGVHIWEGRPCFLSTAHTEEDVEYVIRAFKESVREMKQGGFLPDGGVEETQEVTHPRIEVSAPAPAPARLEVAAPKSEPRPARLPRVKTAPVQFSLYFFGNYEAAFTPDKYDLLFEATKFADAHGFTAVWLPERHFHAVGGFSPNPSVLAAALARETQRIQLRGGSVVFPLHHPIRIAEEWAVVDNLSKGRTGLSIASGWHPNDFVFAPDAFDRRRELCFEGLDVVQKLWRGESVTAAGGAGNDVTVKLHPMPMQAELPIWLTCIHPDSFEKAGEMGVGVLGYLMNQKIDDVAAKIALYRDSLARHGHDPATGHVTILLHTFVGPDLAAARETARGPLRDYLRSFLDNSRKKTESEGRQVDVDPEDIEHLLDVAFEDYVEGKALIGTPESCARVMDSLIEIGVDEVGCFLDFGIESGKVLGSLATLDHLKNRYQKSGGEKTAMAPIDRTLALTPAQQGLWACAAEDGGARAYNESVTLGVRGILDQEALREALQTLVNRHEALRATVEPDGERLRIQPAAVVDLRCADLSAFEAGERKARAAESLARAESELFERHGPFLRARLFKLQEKEHLLLLTFHHLMGNGPWYWVFLDELCALYAAARRGNRAVLAEPMQLSGFMEWDAARRADAADAEAWWLAQFEGGVPVLELPSDRPRPSVLTFSGGRQTLTLDAELTRALRHAAASQRSSLFNLLLAGFGLLLHRLTGQDDVVIGVPFEDEVRTLEGGESLFANTTNVMPIRSRIGGDPAFAEYMAGVKQLVLGASEHQNYFFGNLIDALKLQRDRARAPVFSVIFNFESGEFRKNLDGLQVELLTEDVPYRGPAGTAMAELYLNVAEKNGALEFQCDHNADLYDGETVLRWLGHLQTLLEAVAADPASGVRRLPLLREGERRKIVAEWNATRVEYPKDALLHGVIEEQARKTPDAVAVVFGKESLTFRELDSRANQLAHHLRAKGVAADSLVGICMERSLEMVTGLLGILKAGGAYVPLDPGYPAERLGFMMADARMPVLLTQERLVDKLPPHEAEVICLDAGWFAIARESRERPAAAITPQNLAYVIYTSGSTGKPKGAMNTHAGICNRLFWMQDAYKLTAADRVLQKTPFSFDVSVWEFFWPLLAGARLVMARPGGHQDSGYLIETIVKEGVTVLHFVPPMLAAFLADKDAGSCRSLRCVISSGEALSFDLQEQFFSILPGALHNLYGPTEASVDVTSWACRRDAARGAVPIGSPIANTQIYLLDPQLQPVPIGVAGELHIGGVGLARGYWGRPDLTTEKFIPDPFGDKPDARLYKTGDLARWRADGNIVYLGRIDHQVKVGGVRIELDEIEGALAVNPAVRDAVVIDREDRPGERKLVGYVVPREEGGADISAQLRADLKKHLPSYMVPSALVFLKALPLTANGKVDRRALPAPDLSLRHVEPESGPPQSAIQQKLTAMWATILGLERVGLHENFFELGGNSLLGLRVANELRTLLDEHVALVVLFEAPTIAELSALLEINYKESIRRINEDAARVVKDAAVSTQERDEPAGGIGILRRIVESLRPVEPEVLPAKVKNPRAVFLLSPMRSGSTLCRIMLAGNPALFAPPELQLLGFQNMAARKDAYSGYDRYMLEGALRAIMEIKSCGMEEALKVVQEMENSGCSVQECYRRMQEWIAPKILVDKSPDYAMDLDVLRRAESWFQDALYIHLLRHPLGMIRSYEKGRFILESPYRHKQKFSAREMAELTWLVSHENIREFLAGVPAQRKHQVRFEDIVKDPKPAMESICRFLGIDFHPGMVKPYEEKEKKMTDGVHPLSPQVGDHNFLKFTEVRSDVADQWKSEYTEDFLGEATWRMAREFGYQNPFTFGPEATGSRKELPPIVGVSRAARRVTRATL